MTRKEVIDELQKTIDLIRQNGKDWLDERDIPIIQMAITALELSDSIMQQLDCKMFHSGVNVDNTVSDETTDIIYRQAAIDAALAFLVEYCGAAFDEDMQKMLCERLDALPSAQPEVAKDTNVPNNDCISRQAAIDVLHMDTSIIPYEKAREYADVTILEIRNRLEKLPSAQPEIIMCKDCKYHRQNLHGDSWCAHSKGLAGFGLKPTDFCCYGEWKEDENNKQN